MREGYLSDLVKHSKDDSETMIQLLGVMEPLIKSYTRKLFFMEKADAQQEIYLAIIEAVKNIPQCKTDGQCLTYIQNAVKFKFVHMCKKNMKKEEMEDLYKKDLDEEIYMEKYSDVETFYDLQKKKASMNQKQKEILYFLLRGYSDHEIADKMGISRQYINRIKKKLY